MAEELIRIKDGVVSPAMSVILFSMGTGIIGGIANFVLARRLERTAGTDMYLLMTAVIIASAMNLYFAWKIPIKK